MTISFKNLFIVSLLIKLLLALFIPLTLDEYYYFLWGQRLSLSYFDHPPMVGWLMLFSQPLKAIGEGAIRWPFIFLSHGTLLVWDLILKEQISKEKRRWFLAIGLLNPLWGFGALIATPDLPLLFFWSVALLFIQRILREDHFGDYIGLALSLGFGFLSKYQVALFLPCLVIMLWQQQQLHKLLKPKAWMAVVVALVACSPVFVWNATHDWVSIDFQWKHGMANSKYWKWNIPLEYLVTQIFIVFPTFLIFLFRSKTAWLRHWLTPFALFPFAFFFYSSFKARVEGNWVIMSVPCLLALSVIFTPENLWRYCRQTVVLWAALFILAFGLIQFKDHLPENRIKIFEADRYQPIIDIVEKDKKYYTFNYQLASLLTFKTGRLFCKLPGYGRPDHFQFFDECQDYRFGFLYLTEIDDNRVYSEDFPGLDALRVTAINNDFKIVEVGKR